MKEYILFPDVKEKLKVAGIDKRIRMAVKKDKVWPVGFVSSDCVRQCVGEMNENGFLKTFPQEKVKQFTSSLNKIFKKMGDFNYVISRRTGDHREKIDCEDLLLMTGHYASVILSPNEIWDFERFKFNSISDFTGCVGALISEEYHRNNPFEKSYGWTTIAPGNRTLFNQVTGDMNCDMRVFQTDKTPYPTIDPFGNPVSYRPKTRLDRGGIMAYHSTEGELLAIVLKYIKQRGLNPESLRNDAKEALKWAASLGQKGGTCAEHYGGFDRNPNMFFVSWNFPLIELDRDCKTDKQSFDVISSEFSTVYTAYVDVDGNLVFAQEDGNKRESGMHQKDICAIYTPEDADHLVKGLLFQSASGLGRTSCKQLTDILEYRFSKGFDTEMESARQRIYG